MYTHIYIPRNLADQFSLRNRTTFFERSAQLRATGFLLSHFFFFLSPSLLRNCAFEREEIRRRPRIIFDTRAF